jgi:putative ABC transport system permease protein
MGFVIGLVITYQVLYTDVANHLPEYATLKAMGYSDLYLVGVVFQQSLWLSLLGYAPGIALTWQLYKLTAQATFLPMEITPGRAALALTLTVVMCFLSGLLAMRKLRQADPAEIF